MRRLKLRLPSGKATSHRRVPRSGELGRGHSLGPTETRPLQRRQSACLPRLNTHENSERPAGVLLKENSANEPTGSHRSAESQLLCDCSKGLTHYSAKNWRRGSESSWLIDHKLINLPDFIGFSRIFARLPGPRIAPECLLPARGLD